MYYHQMGDVLYVSLGVATEDPLTKTQRVAQFIPDATQKVMRRIARQSAYDWPDVTHVLHPTTEDAEKGFYIFKVNFVAGTDVDEIAERVAVNLLTHWQREGLPTENALERV